MQFLRDSRRDGVVISGVLNSALRGASVKTIVAHGWVDILGKSRFYGQSQQKLYNSISIVSKEGVTFSVDAVRVSPEVDSLLAPGAEGAFIFYDVFGLVELHAVSIGTREASSGFISGSLAPAFLAMGLLGGVGLVGGLAPFIGFLFWPLVLIAVVWMVAMPTIKLQLVSAAKGAGFRLRNGVRIGKPIRL